MPRVELHIQDPNELRLVEGQWRHPIGLVPAEPTAGLVPPLPAPPPRLYRPNPEGGVSPFGSATYSKEDLRAEFGSAFLCAHAGIDNTLDNSAAYIAGWLKALKGDNKLAITAASAAQKAADYILGE